MNVTDEQWLTLFKQKNINISKINSYLPLKITSKEINFTKEILRSKAKDARLLAKIDHREALPHFFKENGLFLLPIKNGEFYILKGEGFFDIENLSDSIQEFESNLEFELISNRLGDSEMQHLDYSFNTGLLQHHFSVDRMYQTIRGRKFTPQFSFNFNEAAIDVDGVQIEVDGGYEAAELLALIEAKNVKINNFVIRQLYYPFRTYREMVSGKDLKLAFFSHNNGVYSIHDFKFCDPLKYNSIEQIQTKHYRIVSSKKLDNINFPLSPSGQNIIPQADDLNKALELIRNIARGITNSKTMAEQMKFDKRQSSYYREAAEALGLAYKDENDEYRLTEAGKAFIAKSETERKKFLGKQIINIPIFFEIFSQLIKSGRELNKNQIAELIEKYSHLNSTTAKRRSSTIISWLNWFGQEIGLISVSNGILKLL